MSAVTRTGTGGQAGAARPPLAYNGADRRWRRLRPALLALLVGAGMTGFAAPSAPPGAQAHRTGTRPGPEPAVATSPPPAYGRLPLTFEANQGQTDPAVGFVVFLTPTEAAPR